MRYRKVDPATGDEYVGYIDDDDVPDDVCMVAGYGGSSVAVFNIPPGVWVPLILDNHEICHPDAGGLTPRVPWDIRPTKAGYIEIIARWSGTTPGTWVAANVSIAVFKNGALYRRAMCIHHVPAAWPLASVNGSILVGVAPGDVVDVRVSHTGGALQTFTVWDAYVDVHYAGGTNCAGCSV